MNKAKVKQVKPDHTKKVVQFLGVAFEDYVASRVLLNSGLLSQGAVLASTAIEKYFKAIMASRGMESHGHLKTAHWNSVRNLDKALYDRIDVDFLRLCKKSYDLRYTDQLAPGFSIVIAQREFLAELDATVAMIEPTFVRDNGGRETKYQHMSRERDQRLWLNNHVLHGGAKEDWIYAQPQMVQELRQLPGDVLMEVTYLTTKRPDNPSMMRDGILPDPKNPLSYAMSHEPVASDGGAQTETGATVGETT
ncbi:hypothetical protein KTD33_09085 [Burkholderia gladioli]|uniref:hypothetical protein n=1 Tax=Burkholderia gladioli TaxID=28095 RepID=UPI00163DE8EB|nr:hypothetical protein [Burkholderia gladioli]MBU9194688.1 hypothetical protein [Burkholderia gladioli]